MAEGRRGRSQSARERASAKPGERQPFVRSGEEGQPLRGRATASAAATEDGGIFNELRPYLEAAEALMQRMGGQRAAFSPSALASRSVLSMANIVAYGAGYKISNGRITKELAVQVYVAQKVPRELLSADLLIPETADGSRDGIPTDVIPSGVFVAVPPGGLVSAESLGFYTDRYTPTSPCGSSIGHGSVTAGTQGCIVWKDDLPFILSNNHVVAAVNRAQPGDLIYQPGPADLGRTPRDTDAIARIDRDSDVVWLNLNDLSENDNDVDAAIALTNQDYVSPRMHGGHVIGTRPRRAELGMLVHKVGRTTGPTTGKVIGVTSPARVQYGNRFARFRRQLAIASENTFQAFSQPGDSGSLVMSRDGNDPVGLIFAGGAEGGVYVSLANPIEAVIDAFDGFEFVDRF